MSADAVITSVTVDHIPEIWSPNGTRSSAPKNFTVYVSGSSRLDICDLCDIFLSFSTGEARVE